MRRLPILLAYIAGAALAVHGCTIDPAGNSACNGFVPSQSEIYIPGDRACAIAQEGHVSNATTANTELTGPSCYMTCGASFAYCSLPDDYLTMYLTAQASGVDAGGGQGNQRDAGSAEDASQGDARQGDAGQGDAGDAPDAAPASACPVVAATANFILLCSTACMP